MNHKNNFKNLNQILNPNKHQHRYEKFIIIDSSQFIQTLSFVQNAPINQIRIVETLHDLHYKPISIPSTQILPSNPTSKNLPSSQFTPSNFQNKSTFESSNNSGLWGPVSVGRTGITAEEKGLVGQFRWNFGLNFDG